MHNSKDIQTKIDESFDSIAGIARATPRPDLYISIIARIYNLENSFWEKTIRAVSRPAFALISVSIVIAINLLVIISNDFLLTSLASAPEIHTVDDLGANSFYEIENIQP